MFLFSGDKVILSTHFMRPNFNVNRPLYNLANEYALTMILCVYYLFIYLFFYPSIYLNRMSDRKYT